MAKFKDMADEPEDERIREIGELAMTGKKVAFITDADPGKCERYIAKLLKRFPKLRVKSKFDGPVSWTKSVMVELDPGRN